MRTLLVAFSIVLSGLSTAYATGGKVWVFMDDQGTQCNLLDTPGVTQYQVVHELVPEGASSVSFIATLPTCHTGAWLSDTHVFPATTGDSQTGVSVEYGGCLGGTFPVLTINVETFGTTPSCCCFLVSGHPSSTSGQVEYVDCLGDTHVAANDLGRPINADFTCSCECLPPVLPVERSSWGAIKSIFSSR